jgi:uncharacterized protein
MPFEFDPAKSASNKIKHGIDFVEAQAIWTDADRLESPAGSLSEPRFQVLGLLDRKIDRRICAAFITYRGENIRLISVRRARLDERKHYYDHKKNADRGGT